MRRIKKIFIIILIVVVSVYFLAAIAFQVMGFIFKSNPEKAFNKSGITPHKISFNYHGATLNGVTVGADSLPLVVFVHGSPGSWTDFLDNLTDTALISRFHLIAVDRLGYGESSHELVASVQAHADALAELLRAKYPGRKAIWVGHSYGGPVVACIGMQYPNLVVGMVLVAGSIDPEMEKKEWFNELATWRVIQWILPGMMIRSNKEILPLKTQLEEMLPLWKDITAPVTVLQGMEDGLVPKENADFAQRVLVNSTLLQIQRIEKQGHLIPWQKPEVIKNAVIGMLPRYPHGHFTVN